jgi:hypothetical protein
MPRSTDPLAYELSLDLATQELIGKPASRVVEIDDIRDVVAPPHGNTFAATSAFATDDAVEIELSAEEVAQLLDEPNLK